MSNISDMYDGFSRGQNEYFNVQDPKYGKDKGMIDVLINEYFNKFGVCMEYYITSYDTSYDKIWGEDNDRRFVRSFEIMGSYTLPKEDKVWSKFGIEGIDELTIWVSKRHFVGASTNPKDTSDTWIPQIGDVIKAQYSNYFYEITEVAEDTGQFLQSNQFIWELTARPMKNENISVSDELKGNSIDVITSLDDIFDITNETDIEKEDIIYKPKPGEQTNDDPFANW